MITSVVRGVENTMFESTFWCQYSGWHHATLSVHGLPSMISKLQWHIQGGAQGAGAPPKPQRYGKELLRYPSLYQQLLPQTIIWRQKR